MELGARYWLIALAGAIAMHLSLLSLFERPPEPLTVGRGILIELTEARDATEAASGSESPPPGSSGDLPETAPAAPETADSDVATEKSEPTEPEPPPEPVALSEPTPTPKAKPVVAKPAVPRKISKPKKARSPRPKKRAAKTPRETRTMKVTAEQAAAGHGEGKARKGSAKQGGKPGHGSSAAAARNRYVALIRDWLNRNKRYPAQARTKGQEGSVTVRFTLDRDGQVLSSRITRSSGHAALDDEVLALMQRGPMPRMPAAMQQSRMTIQVPIRFRLR